MVLLSLQTVHGASTAGDGKVVVGRFSAGALGEWSSRSFSGTTAYRIAPDGDRNLTVLEARSEQSASAIYRELHVDLEKTPYMHWSWKIHGLPAVGDETTRSSDDYAARIYVVLPRSRLELVPRTLNYVWAARQPVGEIWTSPYSSKVRLVAIDSGTAELGRWVFHRRNILDDLKRAFGPDVRSIDGIAIMTDTDNTGSSVLTYYGDISFSAD